MKLPFTLRARSVRSFCLAFVMAGAAAAQELPAPAERPKEAPADKQGVQISPKVFVRRFSAGGLFSVMAFPAVPSNSLQQTPSSDLTVSAETNSKSDRFGGGVVFQASLTKRLAVTADYLIRKTSFYATSIAYAGTDDTSTTADERKQTTFEQQTRASFSDIPVLLRYYTKDNNRPGRRRFYEGGVAVRKVHGIHSFAQTTNSNGTLSCCDEKAMTPAHTWVVGLVAGVGYQFIDEFKIRFMPELRYTYWVERTFDTLSTRSSKNQLELTVSFTF